MIVRLASRDRELTVTSGPEGPRYTFAEQGKIVIADADEQFLQRNHPEQYLWLRQALAAKYEYRPSTLAGR